MLFFRWYDVEPFQTSIFHRSNMAYISIIIMKYDINKHDIKQKKKMIVWCGCLLMPTLLNENLAKGQRFSFCTHKVLTKIIRIFSLTIAYIHVKKDFSLSFMIRFFSKAYCGNYIITTPNDFFFLNVTETQTELFMCQELFWALSTY